MVDELIWLEMLLKGIAGGMLLTAPTMTAAIAGWPRPGAAFWPRLLGALLIGIVAAFLLATAILQPAATRRGRLLTWLLTAGLFLLSLIEIALA
jgi:hypothetical protein